DVDLEAITILERIMFDQSEKAGQAGNQQWGLDAGPHEDGWNPYIDDPFASEAKRQGSDSELQVIHGLFCVLLIFFNV
ncbi:hypothetical protein K435DRAFT_663093, partial [Dendrothele bispora CBS 962.96]